MSVFEKLFGRTKKYNLTKQWKEVGAFTALYTAFGPDIYRSELVRDCIRPLAEHTSKAVVHSTDKKLERLITYRPNMYMNGPEFLKKCRTIYEVTNNLFVYINRDDRGKVISLYPVPYQSIEALDVDGRLFIKFTFPEGKALAASWADLAVLRKDYLKKDIIGEDNTTILEKLELIHTTNEGLANAIKSTGNLRGIVKSTKANLKSSDIKKMKDDFVADYLSIASGDGIAALDASMEFDPIKMEPIFANAEQTKEFREDIFRYFGVSDAIITANYNESQMGAFYEARIEPFLVDLSLELTSKIFTAKELGFDNKVEFAADRMQFASLSSKLALVSMVDRGALTPNEWRRILNLGPVDGGDVPIRRLDTATVDEGNTVTDEGDKDGEEK